MQAIKSEAPKKVYYQVEATDNTHNSVYIVTTNNVDTGGVEEVIKSKVLPAITRFCSDRTAGVSVIIALTVIPIAVGSGAAIDLSRTLSVKGQLQAAMDSAVISGVIQKAAVRNNFAQSMFQSQSKTQNVSMTTPVFTTNADDSFTGTTTVTVPMTLMKLIGKNTIDLTIKAKASAPIKDDSCILSLGNGLSPMTNSITLNGPSNLNLSGCNLRSNTSMKCNGHSGNADASYAVGSVSNKCQNPFPNAKAIPDIHAKLASNISLQCGLTSNNVTWTVGTPPSSPQLITVVNGAVTEYHVCGNLTLKGTGVLLGNTSSDSVLVVENGDLILDKNADITLTRTAIIMSGTTGSHKIVFPQGNGQSAKLRITPGTDSLNPWRGIGIYQDPNITSNVDISWGPGANIFADGVLYFPNADVTISGNATSNASNCTKLVVNTFTSNGSVALSQSNAGCASLGLKQFSYTSYLLS